VYLSAIETRVHVQSLTGKNEPTEIGMTERGTAYVTSLSTEIMGYHDRLTFVDFSCKLSQVITFDKDGKSTLLHKPSTEMLGFFTDEIKNYYIYDDYELTEDCRQITWLNSYNKPPEGTQVSVLYYTRPTYFILDVIHELRGTITDYKVTESTFVELPKQYMIKREDFIYV